MFTSYIGIDLGGGKGKNTAVAHLRLIEGRLIEGRAVEGGGAARVEVIDYGTGKVGPWYDERLVAYLREHPDAVVAMDAPLCLPTAIRDAESEPARRHASEVARWFEERAASLPPSKKPRYTTYTQRATEVLLAEELGIRPLETLGQGMGPLTARAVFLRAALRPTFELNRNLIEVYPKATLLQLFPRKLADKYKRSAASAQARLEILNQLTDLRFAPGAWREHGLENDHKFDAILCAYTAYLWSRSACLPPPNDLIAEDGWIWVPEKQPGAG